MEYKEVRDSLKGGPTSILPPPPRFDAAASAAARPVERLPYTRIQVPLKPNVSRLINRRSKFLALMAIVGLATGAAGGILVVERDKQQQWQNSASTIQIPTEQTPAFDSAVPAPENNDPSLEASGPVESQVPVRRHQRRPRKQPKRELVVISNADEEEEELDRDEDSDDDEDKDEDRKDRERRRKDRERDRERDADSRRSESSRNRAVLYDVMRARKP